MEKRETMGKRKITIEMIDKKERRQVTFSKRHKGLFKKATEICVLCNAQIAITIFSPGGKPYSFGYPSVNNVLDHYSNGITPNMHPLPLTRHDVHNQSPFALPNHTKNEHEKDGFWWDKIQIGEINNMEELKKVKPSMEKVRENVLKKLGELAMSRGAIKVKNECIDQVLQDDVKVPLVPVNGRDATMKTVNSVNPTLAVGETNPSNDDLHGRDFFTTVDNDDHEVIDIDEELAGLLKDPQDADIKIWF